MFSRIINYLLQKTGVSAYRLSKAIGVSEAIISKWKNGIQEPKYDSLQKLSKYFGVSADYLLGLTDNPNQQNYTIPIVQPNHPDEQRQRLNDNYDALNQAAQKALVDYSDFMTTKPENLKEAAEDNKNVS